ncbi:hypothetical protein FACS189419_05080 [Planctomycetales bacterium]|nr:hypothetical protein FACS189419_05080 [Planctomycetales bacterium]
MIVPIPDTVRDLMKKITFADGDLEEKICKEVTRLAGRIVVRSDFNAEHIPPELRMNIRVLDEKGETIKEDKDLASLRKELTPQTFRAEQPSAAAPASPFAVFYTEHRREIKTQIQWLPNVEKLRIYSQPLPEFKFDEQVGLLIAKRTLGENPGASPPCSITAATQEVTKLLAVMLENYFEARKTLEKHKKLFSRSIDDAGEALKRLVVPHFLTATPWQWLQHYPRYFKAVAVRFEKTAVNADADVAELQRYWKQYEDRKELHYAAGIDDPELETFRWMLEEYRVSLFAQRLGTVVKVSPQRLDKQFEKVRI